ncbi:MAG: hypothetical protein RL260_3832, partial [Pseudomonadota bacterium]
MVALAGVLLLALLLGVGLARLGR